MRRCRCWRLTATWRAAARKAATPSSSASCRERPGPGDGLRAGIRQYRGPGKARFVQISEHLSVQCPRAERESLAKPGGVCSPGRQRRFFLGERVNPEFYNKKLYADGAGLFPAPLADRPSLEMTKDEILERMAVRLTIEAPRYLILRDEKHPIFREIDRTPLSGCQSSSIT